MADRAPYDPSGARERRDTAVGVIVLNFNGAEHVVHCLESLLACDPRPARVAVVDNGSVDDSVPRVRAWAAGKELPLGESVDGVPANADGAGAWLHLMRLSEHRGAPFGKNAGLREMLRDRSLTHFLLLDNDTEVAPDYFSELAAAIDAAPHAGMLSGTIYYFHDRARVWYAGGRSVPWRALVEHRLEVPSDPTPVPTEFVTGCAMVVSRALLERIGPTPECYFPAYVDDADYSFRARESGLAVLYAPAPVVYHKIGTTVGRATVSPRAKYMETRHRGFYVRRNFRGWRRGVALAYLAVTKPGRAVVELLRGHPAMASALLRGVTSGLLSPEARREPAPF